MGPYKSFRGLFELPLWGHMKLYQATVPCHTHMNARLQTCMNNGKNNILHDRWCKKLSTCGENIECFNIAPNYDNNALCTNHENPVGEEMK